MKSRIINQQIPRSQDFLVGSPLVPPRSPWEPCRSCDVASLGKRH